MLSENFISKIILIIISLASTKKDSVSDSDIPRKDFIETLYLITVGVVAALILFPVVLRRSDSSDAASLVAAAGAITASGCWADCGRQLVVGLTGISAPSQILC